ncbi:MAG: PIN domain-containing protein [Fibromonadaceae bacterium]|jgi:predicted nucleic acid-binding protein|nr:PIN domain-containing protein [Fibromonadaceae bacterium]
MKILLDTNIMMDVIEKREPSYKDAVALLKYVADTDVICYFSASSAKDIFYLVKRHTGSLEEAKKAIVQISKFVIFCDTTRHDIQNALLSSVSDFEDAVLVSSAEREDMDFVITRNKKDFVNSVVKAITPIEFLESLRNYPVA